MNRSICFTCLILLGFTAVIVMAQTTRRPTTARAGATTRATTARAGATTARAGATTRTTTARAGATTRTTTARAGATTRTTTAHAGATTATTAAPAATTTTTAATGSTASLAPGSSTTSGSTTSASGSSLTTGNGSTITGSSTTSGSTVSTPSTTTAATVAASISCPPLTPVNVNMTQVVGQWFIQAYTGPPGGGPLATTCDVFHISVDPSGLTGSILYTYDTIPTGAPGSDVASITSLSRLGQFYYTVPAEDISMTATILEFQAGYSYVHVACPTNGGQATVVIATATTPVPYSTVAALLQAASNAGAPTNDILMVSRTNGC